MGASARALANELASDPDGRFGNSELFRLVSGLGSGQLTVESDKVPPRILLIVLLSWADFFFLLFCFLEGAFLTFGRPPGDGGGAKVFLCRCSIETCVVEQIVVERSYSINL